MALPEILAVITIYYWTSKKVYIFSTIHIFVDKFVYL